jgi:broad specificity phosphatase PhoE
LQAEATGLYLKKTTPDATTIYASPLIRAHDTAEIISKSLRVPVTIDPALAEFDFGSLDGLAPEEAYERFPEMDRFWGPTISEPIPGGESSAAVAKRVSEALIRITADHSPDETIIVVSHQGAITMGLAKIMDEEKEFMRMVPSNCGVTWIEMGADPKLVESNYVEHLREIGFDQAPIV